MNETEEARRQVGEQIPTFMRILAQQAAGGDMEKLEQMFKDGTLYTEKYLPAVLAEMKRQSDLMMAEYRESLPYYRKQADRQQDLWLRKFTEQGGERGLLNFWKTWNQIIADSLNSATTLGRIFERGSELFSAALLIPQELLRWVDGETDSRNFFQHFLGDFATNEDVQRLVESFQRIKNNWREALDVLGLAFPSTFKETLQFAVKGFSHLAQVLSLASEAAAPLAKVIESIFNIKARPGETAEKLVDSSPFGAKMNANSVARQEAHRRVREAHGWSSWDYLWNSDPALYEKFLKEEMARFSTPEGMKAATRYRAEGAFSGYSSQGGYVHTTGEVSPVLRPSSFSVDSTYLSQIARNAERAALGAPFGGSSVNKDNLPLNTFSSVYKNRDSRESIEMNVKHDIRVDAKVEAYSSEEAILKVLTDAYREVNPLIAGVPD